MDLSQEDKDRIEAIKRMARQEQALQQSKAQLAQKPRTAAKKPSDKQNGNSLILAAAIAFLGFMAYPHIRPTTHEITAADLRKAYWDDEMAAHQKFEGRKLKVSGTYSTSGVSAKQPYIALSTGALMVGVYCQISGGDVKKAGDLKPGQPVTVTGTLSKSVIGYTLNHCSIN